MVRQVCKKLDYLNPEVSFHRFPTNLERRKLWLSIVGFDEDKQLPKYPEICSDHFSPRDIHTKANGLRYINSDANPELHTAVFVEPSSDSSESTLYEIPREKSLGYSLNTIEEGNILDRPSTSNSATANLLNLPPTSSSATLTASEAEGKLLRLSQDIFTTKNPEFQTKSRVPASKKRKRGYIGNMSSSDFSTPEKRSKNLKAVKTILTNQQRRIHNLQMSVRRLRLKITSLKSVLDYMKEKCLISETSESTIRASLAGPAVDIFERMLKGPTKQKYNPCLRSFALTLSFYSPKAYNFLRNTFNRSLPHLETISKWYRSLDGSPGFTKEALLALTLKQNESSRPLLCNLVMDEMSIRRQVEWDGRKFTGYVDIGTNLDGDTLPEAREVLVFMLVCLNGSWKLPVGYFLLDGLSATEKAGLVRKCLEFIAESKVVVTSLTFDGAPTNIAMAERLGADFSNISNLKTSFTHPITNDDVYIYLDACHMLKLVRNCLASQQGIRNASKQDVKWEYITNLVKKQNTEGLHAATKIRLRHLAWGREKMKVRLATQTLSRSVSTAISYLCEDLKCPEFKNSEATSDFLMRFNNLFDIFNSRNRFVKYLYKRPLSPKTADHFFEYMKDMADYISSLTLGSRPITSGPRKTGFLGFLICIESLKKMYHKYVVEKKLLKYILTYKVSQDHLELFFGAIRSKGGHNNNPTARQFQAAYKRLLVHAEICGPDTGNAVNLEKITILTCGSSSKISSTENGENLEESEEYLAFMQKIKDDINSTYRNSTAWNLTIYAENVVSYIAGFVVKGLKKCVNCPKCLYLIESDISNSLLQNKRQYGRLTKASKLVIDVCQAAEKFFKFFHTTESIFNKNSKNLMGILITNSMANLPVSVFESFGEHLYDGDALGGHHLQLVELILKNYFKIRIHHESMKHLDASKQNRSRSINTKLILFRNE